MVKSRVNSGYGRGIAVVGMGCRFPDAANPAAFADLIVSGRRAFRRIPPCRVDLADYYSAAPATSDATYSTRAALIEGWQFDAAAFGVPAETFAAADPAHWLALETAASALTDAGFPAGTGLPRDRTAVVIGNTLGGETSRASALRLRWPYVRQVVAEALHAEGLPPTQSDRVLRRAAARYLAPFPPVTSLTLAGASPAGLASGIGAYFGFRAGSFALDGGGASSLLAVASACAALASGEIDVAVAGGVDLSLDPLDLVGMAKAGLLARFDMRIYDENPTGFLPGEGCGIVVLMRDADARAAGCRVYAGILGWGTAEAGQAGSPPADPGSVLLALRRAYGKAGVDPADVMLIEGAGTGIAAADAAELTALAELRQRPRRQAVLGSVTAGIGHSRAAAGAAGLIKTVLAVSRAVLPPAAGVRTPHPIARDGGAGLRFPRLAERWPEGERLAGVSAAGLDELTVHLVLRDGDPPSAARRWPAARRRPPQPGPLDAAFPVSPAAAAGPDLCRTFLVHAPDRQALAAALRRIADVAPWLSDGELDDLACQLGRQAASQGPARAAIVATRQEQLARLASEAAALVPGLADGLLAVRPGFFAADGANGRVTLLLPDSGGWTGPADPAGTGGGEPGQAGRGGGPAIALAVLAWLDELGVRPRAAVGAGAGWLAGLAWAGCVSQEGVLRLAAARAEALRGRPADVPDRIRTAVSRLGVRAPSRRLLAVSTGRELSSCQELAALAAGEAPGPADGQRRAAALRAASVGASLLLETGPGAELAAAAAAVTGVPAISLLDGADRDRARAAAALFASGALSQPGLLFAGLHWRPIDIWRERVFITSPCQVIPAAARPGPAGTVREPQAPASEPHITPGEPSAGAREPSAAAAEPPAAAEPGPGSTIGEPSAAAGEPSAAAAEPPAAAEPGPANTVRAPQGPAQARAEEPRAGEREPEPGSTVREPLAPAAEPPAAAEPGPASTAAAAAAAPAPSPADDVGCFIEELRELTAPGPAARRGPWRVHAAGWPRAGSGPIGDQISELFPCQADAARTLAVLGPVADLAMLRAAASAARDAIETGQLTVISTGRELAGLWACLHAEHPGAGITVIRAPGTIGGLRAARDVPAAAPGQYRELVIGDDGQAREAVMVPAPAAAGGKVPLSERDVVLISRESGPAGAALAQVAACAGAATVVIGIAPAGQDDQFGALNELRAAGAAIGFADTDLGDAPRLDAAVDQVEREFGAVTVIAHGVRPMPARPAAALGDAEIAGYRHAATAGLTNLLGAVAPDPLRLIITFGTAAARHGIPGQAPLALAAGALAGTAGQLAASIGCRWRHVDWPAVAPDERGWQPDPAGTAPDPGWLPAAAARLLKVLASPGPSAEFTITAPAGPASARRPRPEPAGQRLPGRFCQQVLAHEPGAELLVESELSPDADPYLDDHLVAGLRVLPVAVALEAMAQAASALAGEPLRRMTRLAVHAPVAVPTGRPGQRIRIRARRRGGAVTVSLRSALSGYAVDHLSAEFGKPTARPSAGPRRAGGGTAPAARAAEAAKPGGDAVTAADLYGQVLQQDGRFRRVQWLPAVTARGSAAVISGEDDRDWFGTGAPGHDSLVLGSPGLTDALLQVVQACVPHRLLLPAGGQSATFSGRTASGQIRVRAVRSGRSPGGGGRAGAAGDMAAARALVPPQRDGGRGQPDAARGRPEAGRGHAFGGGAQPEAARLPGAAWDVTAVDEAGHELIRARGLRFRDAGAMRRSAPWPAPLLAAYLEWAAADLGLAADLRVSITRVSPADNSDQLGRPKRRASARTAGGVLAGYRLRVSAACGAACGWRTAAAPSAVGAARAAAGPRLAAAEAMLSWSAEPAEIIRARAMAVCDCLPAAAGDGPFGGARDGGEGWVVLSAGPATIACVAVPVAGIGQPVAIAIRTGAVARAGPAPARSGRSRQRAAARRAG